MGVVVEGYGDEGTVRFYGGVEMVVCVCGGGVRMKLWACGCTEVEV